MYADTDLRADHQRGARHRGAYCTSCERPQVFRKPGLHWGHEIATVYTLGLWGVVWAGAAVRRWREPWRCSVCGHDLFPRVAPLAQSQILPTPRLIAREVTRVRDFWVDAASVLKCRLLNWVAMPKKICLRKMADLYAGSGELWASVCGWVRPLRATGERSLIQGES